MRDKNTSKGIFQCPSFISSMKNVYEVRNMLDATVKLPEWIERQEYEYPQFIDNAGLLRLTLPRQSSLAAHTNIIYNMTWLFFADEPVRVRVTAPYFPPASPAPGVILAAGEFDIGQWYRDFNLDYHVPHGTTELTFKQDQPLFYLDIQTDKRIQFKRYNMTGTLRNLANECGSASQRYGAFKSLRERYDIAKQSKLQELVLSEIRKNAVE